MRLCFKKPKVRETKKTTSDHFFLMNGAHILENTITSLDGKCNPLRNFSVKELQSATNYDDPQRIFARGRGCIWYKGFYESRYVAIKKFASYKKFLEDSINGIAISSQINHKNVLKLLGYCLETEIPIHVYEFPCNGRLLDHICPTEENINTLPWDIRLKIAIEIADAVTYLHTGTKKTIIHRDIHAETVFLDQNYVAKLSNLDWSLPIPLGQTHVREVGDCLKEGTPGFMAPESDGTFTEKRDVFSFGMFLLELLAGPRFANLAPLDRAQGPLRYGVLLADRVRYLIENDHLHKIVDPKILEDGKMDQKKFRVFIDLAIECTRLAPEERPMMMDVAKELRGIRTFVSPPSSQ